MPVLRKAKKRRRDGQLYKCINSLKRRRKEGRREEEEEGGRTEMLGRREGGRLNEEVKSGL